MALADDEYPARLREIYDPPPFLWVRGRLTAADANAVAVVGTRRASDYGRRAAEAFAGDLARAGVTVVSGLAYGVDVAAHRAALAAGGRTVAVLGSGVDHVYPSRHAPVVREILETDAGAVVSELPLGATPDAPNFPRRNRIVSGMSVATVVAEAHDRGGALLTAAIALEQNREVFAVPTSVFSAATGTNRMVQRGLGTLAGSAADVLEVGGPADRHGAGGVRARHVRPDGRRAPAARTPWTVSRRRSTPSAPGPTSTPRRRSCTCSSSSSAGSSASSAASSFSGPEAADRNGAMLGGRYGTLRSPPRL